MANHSPNALHRSNTLQSSLMRSRRWSTPGHTKPALDLYTHYINGVNENAAMLREHRKWLVKTADGRSRGERRAAYNAVLSTATTAATILAWSRDKYKSVRKRQQCLDYYQDKERTTPNSTLTRKTTMSRLSERARSRESTVRRISHGSMLSHPDTEQEEKVKNIRTFWWYCRVIKAICKLGLDMQKLSMFKTEKTALSELYYVSISGTATGDEEDNQILFFDKSLFTRKRATSRMPEWAENLMIKKPEQRKPAEVERLKHLLSSMRSFREKFTDSMRTKMCNKGRVVLRQGHYGQDFYFIFSGSVFIQIDLVDAKTGEVTPSTENIIRSGESFGEIALLGDGTRSASVVCREPTELCRIDKDTFLDICPALFEQQLQEKIQFAREFKLFENFTDEQLKQLCFLSQVLYIPHGRVMELDWGTANYAYFVMRGRVSLIKEFEVSDETEEDVREDSAESKEDRGAGSGVGQAKPGGAASPTVEKKRPPSGSTHKRFACVGTLRAGQSTDLRILTLEPPSIPPITLLSEGARVLRVAVRNFSRFAPWRHTEEYLKKRYKPLKIPSSKSLIARYLRDVNWFTFRKCVIGTLQRERKGQLVANIPATSKGSSGWARWPGFDPDADVKSGILSERGARSEIDDFPLVKLPPPQAPKRRAADAAPAKVPDFLKQRTTTGIVDPTEQSPPVHNDRRLILLPPVKRTPTFLRKSLAPKTDPLQSKPPSRPLV
ncbi:hypothetical protein BaRGS_00035102 [Batillaria attramentaria]|uniref:Cyclic nucleotide-binding domain-containing protein n=1 Tax=Batillaria attramentaria TaxID=370345 RepID=A0ABD0JFT9_9CAEN